MDTTVIMDTTTPTRIGTPNGENLDLPRVETADDSETVAQSLCALATALEQDRGITPTRTRRATPDGKPEDRSGVNGG